MRVLIDINPLCGFMTGIGNFIFHLVEALLKKGGDVRYRLYGPDVRRDPFPNYQKELQIGFRTYSREVLEHLARYGCAPRLPADVDVYHLPYPALPFHSAPNTRFVVTIHDLAFLFFPEYVADRLVLRHLMRSVSEQVARADHIMADSQSTALDIMRVFGTPPAKVSVVYPGFDQACFHPEPEPTDVDLPYPVPHRFILCVGTIEPRKNHLTLVRAFEQFVRRTGDRETHLVLAGGLGWQYDPVCAYIEQSDARHRILHLSGLPNTAIAALYRRALFTVYPSLYEGFGLPVLEAMACGSPVITSSISSLPEVAGVAALLVNPRNVEELTEALVRLSSEEGLRAQLREAGLRQASRFSWERAACEVLDVYLSRGNAKAMA